ncbi:MAG: PilZ domain-containing protein [Planctomycetota bacterium]
MPDAQSTERRRHPRHPLVAGVMFRHGPTRRQFPARCADISQGGLKMYVPASTPVQPGQPVRVRVDGVYRPELSRLAHGAVAGTVVRVDRMAMMRTGHLAVGVRFDATA